jgi:hypothetical protein
VAIHTITPLEIDLSTITEKVFLMENNSHIKEYSILRKHAFYLEIRKYFITFILIKKKKG